MLLFHLGLDLSARFRDPKGFDVKVKEVKEET